MNLSEALYRDSLLRWLQARREYPWDNTPEPQPPTCPGLACASGPPPMRFRWLSLPHQARADVLRDFFRPA